MCCSEGRGCAADRHKRIQHSGCDEGLLFGSGFWHHQGDSPRNCCQVTLAFWSFQRQLQGTSTPLLRGSIRRRRATEGTPFALTHLDHTELDFVLVSSLTGKLLGKPWIALLTDAWLTDSGLLPHL